MSNEITTEQIINALEMGAWGNYMTQLYLDGTDLDGLIDTKGDTVVRLLSEAKEGEEICVELANRLKEQPGTPLSSGA